MSAGLWLRSFPHVLVAAVCTGVAAANLARPDGRVFLLVAMGTLGVAACAGRAVVRVGAVLLALAAAGLFWGALRLDALDRSALLAEVGKAGRAVVVVTGPARRGPFSIRAPARAKRFGRLVVDEPVLLKLPRGRSPPQGARLEAIASIELPRPPRDGFDERAWLRRQGVHVVLRVSRWRIIGHRGGLGGLADSLRERLARSMAPGLEGERRAVVAGVVLGEDAGLSEELRDRFRASGLYHLLAVSGQNVALVVAGVLITGWLLGLPRWLGEIGALGAIGGYLLAVGPQPSVIRAGVAGALGSLAWLCSRERDRWYFLLVGALVLLAWNPYALRDPGFQLSFAAVSAIFLLVPRIQHRLEGYPIPPGLAVVISVSAACGIVTAPILWLQFHAIPLLTIPANAVAGPAVAPLLGLALAAAALQPVAPSASVALAWLNGWCAAYLAGCARLIGGLPLAEIRSTTALVALGLLVAAVGLLPRARARRSRRALAVVVACALGLAGWQLRPEPSPLPPTGLRMTVLDVGQGDSTLLQVAHGAVLVDQGPPEAGVADQLLRLGVRRLAMLILSHPSRDNIGGAEEIVEKLAVDVVLYPDLPFDNPYGGPALVAAQRRGARRVVTRAGQTYRLGRLRLDVLWPDAPALPGDDPNDHATVLLASYGQVEAFLPADAESNVTLPLRLPRVEICKVGHHGSADEGLPDLLDRLRPSIGIISVGAHNEYGHPRSSTVATLRASPGLALYRTDEDGRIVVETDGERIEVERER